MGGHLRGDLLAIKAGKDMTQTKKDLAFLSKNMVTEVEKLSDYYHSVLGLLHVHSTVYDRELDVFAPCRVAGGRDED